jgi:hypothetical protein
LALATAGHLRWAALAQAALALLDLPLRRTQAVVAAVEALLVPALETSAARAAAPEASWTRSLQVRWRAIVIPWALAERPELPGRTAILAAQAPQVASGLKSTMDHERAQHRQ